MITPPDTPPVPCSLRWSGHTDRGTVRLNNEDSFLGLQFDAREIFLLGKEGEASVGQNDFVFAVSDGMGGAMAGEYASRATTDRVTRLLPQAFRQSAEGLATGFGDILTELFAQIHRSLVVVGGSYEECLGMQATLSLCWFTPGWMYFGHVGDSRIYYLSKREGGKLTQISHDDTHVGWLFRNGQLSEWEARNHPRRHLLQKALGADNQFIDPEIGAVAYEPGDRFLLCTDGLVEGLFGENLQDLLGQSFSGRDGAGIARTLVSASLEGSGRDNTTAWVIEVGGA